MGDGLAVQGGTVTLDEADVQQQHIVGKRERKKGCAGSSREEKKFFFLI